MPSETAECEAGPSLRNCQRARPKRRFRQARLAEAHGPSPYDPSPERSASPDRSATPCMSAQFAQTARTAATSPHCDRSGAGTDPVSLPHVVADANPWVARDVAATAPSMSSSKCPRGSGWRRRLNSRGRPAIPACVGADIVFNRLCTQVGGSSSSSSTWSQGARSARLRAGGLALTAALRVENRSPALSDPMRMTSPYPAACGGRDSNCGGYDSRLGGRDSALDGRDSRFGRRESVVDGRDSAGLGGRDSALDGWDSRLGGRESDGRESWRGGRDSVCDGLDSSVDVRQSSDGGRDSICGDRVSPVVRRRCRSQRAQVDVVESPGHDKKMLAQRLASPSPQVPLAGRASFREAARNKLAECETVGELEGILSMIRSQGSVGGSMAAPAYTSKKERSSLKMRAQALLVSGSELLQDGEGPAEGWRKVFQQVVGQEIQHRRFALGHRTLGRNDSGGARVVSATSEQQNAGAVERQASGAGSMRSVPSAGGPGALKDPLCGVGGHKDPRREQRWRSVYYRYATSSRISRDIVPKALELCGFPVPNQLWIEELCDEVTKVSMLTQDEYVRFVHKYEQRQEKAWLQAFEEADEDKSGTIDAAEISNLLRDAFSIEPTQRLLNDLLNEVDVDNSGALDFEEFVHLMQSLRQGEGFTRAEREEFKEIFGRFDRDKTGSIETAGVAGALGWQGYGLTEDEVEAIVSQVDVNGSGDLDLHEFTICMRKVKEREIEMLRLAIQEFDDDGSGTVSMSELESLLASFGYVPSREAVVEACADAGVDEDLDLDELLEFFRLYRQREGLSRTESAEVESAFRRYDTERNDEISAVDVGKALRWFGYTIDSAAQAVLVDQVDVDKSGRLDLSELRKLLRMYWEGQIYEIRAAFSRYDKYKLGSITSEQAAVAFKDLGMAVAGVSPEIPRAERDAQGKVPLTAFIRAGIHVKKKQRDEFRKNGGYSSDELDRLRSLFKEFDGDNSGSINLVELGQVTRRLFPVITLALRPKLDQLMQELQTTGTKALSFQDFICIVRQFHDIQMQEKVDKERRAVEESGFTYEEVKSFRELFVKGDEDGHYELSFDEVKKMVSRFCALGERNSGILKDAFDRVRKTSDPHVPDVIGGTAASIAPPANPQAQEETLDFPEFLRLMRELLDMNFGNVKDRKPTTNLVLKGEGLAAR